MLHIEGDDGLIYKLSHLSIIGFCLTAFALILPVDYFYIQSFGVWPDYELFRNFELIYWSLIVIIMTLTTAFCYCLYVSYSDYPNDMSVYLCICLTLLVTWALYVGRIYLYIAIYGYDAFNPNIPDGDIALLSSLVINSSISGALWVIIFIIAVISKYWDIQCRRMLYPVTV